MAEPIIRARTYVTVCTLLVLLTVLTVGISFAPLEGHWHLLIGLLIGLSKATLVGLFFMHLIISSRLTWIVVLIACLWLVVVLFGLTLVDYLTRVPLAA